MKTSELFKGEKQKRKLKYDLFKKKFSLFDKKKRQSIVVKLSKPRRLKTKKPIISLIGINFSKRGHSNDQKENLDPGFYRRRKSDYSISSSGQGIQSKRHSLVNISRAYSKYKNSQGEAGSSFRRTSKNWNRKSRRKSGKKSKMREKSDSNQARSRFIEIDKGGSN